MPDPGDYTVGWICAISTEYVAAQTFLDEEHEGGPDCVSSNDDNVYTLGKIGKHNVVIATLPSGEYGTVSAAGVARDMLHTFPNIRVGLMVGIGGGCPSPNHDIRLGDVVVSASQDGKGAVFHYDFGKMIQGQPFHPTALLSEPPRLLRSATQQLQALYERKGHQIEQAINKVFEKSPRLQKKYKRPDKGSDKLYYPSVTQPPRVVDRPERTEDEDNPAIHYGRIASANKVIKDAAFRDSLAEEENILCFEMEAAGLMNHFPCLVIRGICDYSDSHKNKEWQGYAAMTAAAYAKDLLCQIPPNKVEAERKLVDIVSTVAGSVNEIRTNIQIAGDDVKELKSQTRQAKLNDWLSPPDPSINYEKSLVQRQRGTGSWLLDGDAFEGWKTQGRSSFLWIYGNSGSGKTILSSTIIENLSSYQPLYFFFDFSDAEKRTFENMIRALIKQLYYQGEENLLHLESLYSSHKNGNQQPSCQSLCETFFRIIEQTGETWIVLDALDECRKEERKELLLWMNEIQVNPKYRNVHLLVTSRWELDIESGVLEFSHINYTISIQSDIIANDISAYVRWRVREGDGLKRWRSTPKFQDKIEKVIEERAGGMFRWVVCQLDALEVCLDRRSLLAALKSLPTTMDDVYARTLTRIPEAYQENAIRILQFLAYSERPLKVEEIIDMTAVDIEGTPYFDPEHRMPDPSEILLYCSSLVIAVAAGEDSKGVNLQLAHFSVKEYLTSGRVQNDILQHFQELKAKASMANICLAYMLHLGTGISPSMLTKSYPFAEYCAMYWMTFAAVAEGQNQTDADENQKLRTFSQMLFDADRCLYLTYYNLYSPDFSRSNRGQTGKKTVSALYYASLGGLVNTVDCLLSQGADVNAQGNGYHGNALQAASAEGHSKVVELLLSKGADVNAQSGKVYDNALQSAAERGHYRVVELLVDNGADINAPGFKTMWSTGSALQAASAYNRERVVELLLSKGADTNIQSGRYGNALQAALQNGHDRVAEMLVGNGANVNAKGGKYGHALYTASHKNRYELAKLLISKGADVNAHGGLFYDNALQAASIWGFDKIVELLLDNGADVNIQGGRHGTALQAAIKGRHNGVVELLLRRGAKSDLNAKNII
ncbi:hypothetical protein TWF694_003087 [Orbilia ellipsospora]|uniref:Uncharacterized protein n=1 Tax=Orbilia ellipsospora TaxID=2528407 RepID=A0AAV9X6L8_9PEZI